MTDRLLLAIFYHTGMRLSELVNLREKQVEYQQQDAEGAGEGQ